MLLLRRYFEDRTEGKYVLPEGVLSYCLERPWLDNKSGVSCIPEGTYIVKRDKTGRFQWYAITNVKDRTNIELHPANLVSQLQGCQAPCLELRNGRGISSKTACQRILDKFGDNSFVLEIRKWHPRDGKFFEELI